MVLMRNKSGILEKKLIPTLISHEFARNPFAPLLYSVMTIFNHKVQLKMPGTWKLLKTVVTFRDSADGPATKKEILLATVYGHMAALSGSQRTLQQARIQAEFVSNCVYRCDRNSLPASWK